MTQVVEVRGLRELREAFMRKIPAELQGKVLQAALVASARPVIAASKDHAPSRTGILRTSIHSEKDRTNTTPTFASRAVRVRSRRAGRRIRSFEAKRGKRYTDRNRGSGAAYWWYQEFGTKFIQAKHFMSRGFESSQQSALNELVRGMKNAMVDVIRKARWGTPR